MYLYMTFDYEIDLVATEVNTKSRLRLNYKINHVHTVSLWPMLMGLVLLESVSQNRGTC